MSAVESEDEQFLRELSQPALRQRAFQLVVEKYAQRLYYFLRQLNLSHDDADERLQDALLKFRKNTMNQQLAAPINIQLYQLVISGSLAYLQKQREVRLNNPTIHQWLVIVLKEHQNRQKQY